jgi:hypothetical protein
MNARRPASKSGTAALATAHTSVAGLRTLLRWWTLVGRVSGAIALQPAGSCGGSVARAGRLDEARLAFETMLIYANHTGLYSEEIGPTGE